MCMINVPDLLKVSPLSAECTRCGILLAWQARAGVEAPALSFSKLGNIRSPRMSWDQLEHVCVLRAPAVAGIVGPYMIGALKAKFQGYTVPIWQ